ncbi:hypothetical protein GOV05_05195 [Candidatus Woesearchaeota archaeon]|nr:hypothetical protein [Candidatus Woesearchaeota archaeon]
MYRTKEFLAWMIADFKQIKNALSNILSAEQKVHDDILVKKGFVIKRHSLRYDKINTNLIRRIRGEVEKIKNNESQLLNEVSKRKKSFVQVEESYKQTRGKKLHLLSIKKELKEVLHYTDLLITRLRQAEELLSEGLKLHKKNVPKNVEVFFASFEHITNKVLRFIDYLDQVSHNALVFESQAFYQEPRTYGRIMSTPEYKKTVRHDSLSSNKDPTPVFDAPRKVIDNILSMNKDQLKNFASQIGVTGGVKVVFFRTRLKPVNHDRPIPQSNGLREYKFPKGISVEVLQAA